MGSFGILLQTVLEKINQSRLISLWIKVCFWDVNCLGVSAPVDFSGYLMS